MLLTHSSDESFPDINDNFFMRKAAKVKSKGEQEALDREFAFFLQNGPNASSSRPPASSQNGVQRSKPLSQNTIQRTLSWGKKPSSSSNSLKIKTSPSKSDADPSSVKLESDDSDIEIISSTEFASSQSPRKVKKEVKRESAGFGSPSGMSNGLEQAIYGKSGPKEWMNNVKNERDLSSIPKFGVKSEAGPSNAYLPGSGSVYAPSPTIAMPGAFPGAPEFGVNVFSYTMNNLPQYNTNNNSVIDLSSSDELDVLRRAIAAGDEDVDPRYEHIIGDPRKSDQEIKDLLANIRPDEDLPAEDREGTPEGLKYPLYEHQKLALTWLKKQEDGRNKGAILADDMGLGKTISALALMLSNPPTSAARKTTLIVGPVALVRQWEHEINVKIKAGHKLTTFMLHGAKTKKLGWHNINTYDVVLTTYGTLGAEFKRLEKYKFPREQRGEILDNNEMAKIFPCLSPKSLFFRVILDEGQCIKNKATTSAKACYHLKSLYRLVLTGTPMMNSVKELYSLILFLRIKPFNEWTRFRESFGTLFNARQGNERTAMKRLQVLLKAILLRRMKNSLIDGKPIIELPPKTEEIQHVVFDEEEQAFYRALENKTQVQFNKYLKKGTVTKNYANVLVLLLRLRQACCHPHLIHDFEEAPNDLDKDEMIELAKTLTDEVVQRILNLDDNFECPICYDGIPNPAIFIPCGHDCCAECLSRLLDTAAQDIAHGHDGAASNCKCPNCRVDISRQKTIDYNTFKKVYKNEGGDEEETASEDDSDDSDQQTDSDDESDGDRSDGDLRGFVVPDDVEDSDEEEAAAETEDEVEGIEEDVKPKARVKRERKSLPLVDGFSDSDDEFWRVTKKEEPGSGSDVPAKKEVRDVKPKKEELDEDLDDKGEAKIEDVSDIEDEDIKETPRRNSNAVKKVKSTKVDKKGKGKAGKKNKKKKKEKRQHVSIAMLKKEAMKNKKAHKRYMRYLRKHWEPSAKVTKCMELLDQFQKEGEKTIVFSQFVSLLDLIQIPIEDKGWDFERYDGSMKPDDRNDAVVRFTERSRSKVMLISLKAGNAGINLVAATRVIILDPFWNPYIEMQAVDRAHRIGQQKPVQVNRILIKGTVEDRIMELQEQKRAMVDAALDEDGGKNMSRLGVEQLTYLFGLGGNAPRD